MKSKDVLIHCWKQSTSDYQIHKKIYRKSFLCLIALEIFNAFPWEMVTGESNSGWEIAANVLIAILSIIVSVEIINIFKSTHFNRPKESLLYTFPTFFVYTLYYTLILGLGILCLVIPGILAFIFLGLAPLASIMSPQEPAFKKSIALVKKKVGVVVLAGLITLALEFIPLVADLIPLIDVRLLIQIGLAVPIAWLTLMTTQTLVRIYLFLVTHK